MIWVLMSPPAALHMRCSDRLQVTGKVETHNVRLVLSLETETSAWIGDVI